MRRWPRSFREANRRRVDLIRLGSLRSLTEEEWEEYRLLDALVDAWVNYRFPVRMHPDLEKDLEWARSQLDKETK